MVFEQLRPGEDGIQRIAQIVSQNRREHLVEAQRFSAVAQLVRNLLLLTIQLEEDIRLVPEDVRLDRLVQEVDGAALVAPERPPLVARAGGDEDDRYVPCAFAASHQLGERESVHFRHLHVEQRQGDVVRQKQIQGLRPGMRRQHHHVLAPQQRLEDQQVLVAVVDDQALHRCWHRERHRLVDTPPGAPASNVWNSAAISSSVRTKSTGPRLRADSGISGACAVSGGWTTAQPPAKRIAWLHAAASWLAPVKSIASSRWP